MSSELSKEVIIQIIQRGIKGFYAKVETQQYQHVYKL